MFFITILVWIKIAATFEYLKLKIRKFCNFLWC